MQAPRIFCLVLIEKPSHGVAVGGNVGMESFVGWNAVLVTGAITYHRIT
jgi:hypothetical protein